MAWPTSRCVTVLAPIVLCTLCGSTAWGAHNVPPRQGKVIIIRGAFTVFSLGLNELGEKLSQYGLDVEVIADISADRATSKLISDYRRGRNVGPIVFVGHSRGAELGPDQARELQRYKIPVKLVVMVDAVHSTTIPANVEQCVNLYHESPIGFIHGVPARADSRRTKLRNVDIAQLRTRDQGGSINHFNIDASPWIHKLVIQEVLKVCPVVESARDAAIAAKSTKTGKRGPAAVAQRPSATRNTQEPVSPARPKRSASGLTYPRGIAGDLWSEPPRWDPPTVDSPPRTDRRESAPPQRERTDQPRTAKRTTAGNRAEAQPGPGTSKSAQPRSRAATRSDTRTAARPPNNPKPRSSTPKSDAGKSVPNRTSGSGTSSLSDALPSADAPSDAVQRQLSDTTHSSPKEDTPVQTHVND